MAPTQTKIMMKVTGKGILCIPEGHTRIKSMTGPGTMYHYTPIVL